MNLKIVFQKSNFCNCSEYIADRWIYIYLISDTYSELDQSDIFWSLTGRYRPLPCKVSIQLQSPLSDVGDRPMWSLPGGAGRGVCSDQLHFGRGYLKWTLSKPSAVLTSAEDNSCHTTSVRDGPQYLWRHERTSGTREASAFKNQKGKKVCRFPDDVFFHPDSVQLCGRTGSNPFLTNKLQILTWIASSWN